MPTLTSLLPFLFLRIIIRTHDKIISLVQRVTMLYFIYCVLSTIEGNRKRQGRPQFPCRRQICDGRAKWNSNELKSKEILWRPA